MMYQLRLSKRETPGQPPWLELYSKPFESLDAAVTVARKTAITGKERLNIIDESGAVVWEFWIDRRHKCHMGHQHTPEIAELHA